MRHISFLFLFLGNRIILVQIRMHEHVITNDFYCVPPFPWFLWLFYRFNKCIIFNDGWLFRNDRSDTEGTDKIIKFLLSHLWFFLFIPNIIELLRWKTLIKITFSISLTLFWLFRIIRISLLISYLYWLNW